jgi:CRISPR type III-A-associated protein Csm2
MNYLEQAEDVMRKLGKVNPKGGLTFELTTSKIRNLLSMVSEIYNDALTEAALTPALQERIMYLNVRMVYEAGREVAVKAFLEKSDLRGLLGKVGGDREKFIEFCRYFEALVAFHRFLGGKDK